MKNGKGYALVTVLLTVVLIVTVSTVLMSSVLSSRKLVNISEEEMQAIDLAEMGVIHLETAINNFITSEITSDLEKNILYEEIKLLINSIKGNIDKEHTYKTELYSSNEDKLKFEVRITGEAHGKPHFITVKFELEKDPGGGIFFPKSPHELTENYDEIIHGPLPLTKNSLGSLLVYGNVSTQNKHANLNVGNHLYVLGGIELNSQSELNIAEGGHLYVDNILKIKNKAKVIIKSGNLYANNKIELEAHAVLEVYGDAYIKEEVTFNKNNSKICISGTTRIWDGEDWQIVDISTDNSCKKQGNENNNPSWKLNIKEIEYYKEKEISTE